MNAIRLPLQVTCALLVKNGLILAAQRNENTSLPLKWELPGGKIEKGEIDTDCIRRELMEELLISVDIIDRLPTVQHQYATDKIIELIPFVCTPIGEPVQLEHKALRWMPLSTAMDLDWADADKIILHQYVQTWQSRMQQQQ